MVLKRKLGPKTWAMEAIMEAVCKGRGSGSWGDVVAPGFATNWPRFLLHFSHDYRRSRSRSDHDRASIGRRSCSISSISSRSIVVESIPQQMECDCGSIAPRSRPDRAAIVGFFHDSS